MKYICQLCATKYEVKNPSVVKKTNEGVKYLRCPKDNGYAFQEPTTEKMEAKVVEAKEDVAKERQNKAETPPAKKPGKKAATKDKDVKEVEVADKN